MNQDEAYRAARKVLSMVHELHLRGYQLIRIAPGVAPSGLYWRCSVTVAANVFRSHGARIQSRDRLAVHYSSADGTQYFGWKTAGVLSPSELADRFVTGFPEITAAGRGRDWVYVGWYVEMLGLTYPDAFPIAYSNDGEAFPYLETIGSRASVRVPMPPPGLVEDEEAHP